MGHVPPGTTNPLRTLHYLYRPQPLQNVHRDFRRKLNPWRSPKLKKLKFFWLISKLVPKAFVEVVQKLPLLEELNLTRIVVNTQGIEALGHYCPHLKSFKLNCSGYMGRRNNAALAIGRYLPALHHLQLIGNNMTNEGLRAILDGWLSSSCIT
ncbi:hypothetical protein H5410_040051 [Solanum commersonii]|uniref:Uncharacterized protein n=1 Tax=Solanum commersonii TaxID=4109 RepID=A0A9J5XMS5_SOLCO|nr:hypothetical protein H5410_040051 [Solanum commersonii]